MKKLLFGCLIATTILLLTLFPIQKEVNAFHSPDEMSRLTAMLSIAEFDPDEYFPKSEECGGCHGYDLDGFASVDAEGIDVNVYDDWRSTMMANSAKDPFWRAKVSHEILVNPDHREELEDQCITCHAPMGHYTALFRGHEYGMDSLLVDSIGLDGVSCGACHQISPENLGNTFSGEINYDTSRVQYGPYPSPFGAPMISFAGFSPMQSEHINDAGLCAGCHTLIVESVDLDGNATGTTFVEQATYHEWVNSLYEDSVSCQGCHIPRIQDSVVISDNYLFLQGRTPYGKHELVGANTFMLQLMKEHKDSLKINATDENYDETIAKTFQMLQQQSLDLDLELVNSDIDSAYFKVSLLNKAGHKFPTGYPSRRAFIEFVITREDGSTLFSSGELDNTYEVIGQDAVYEPHYNVINDPEQVQIYELVNGDVNGNFSTVLERGYAALKDNRLPPLGFSKSHYTYDTTLIVGAAVDDPNFNYTATGAEGSGSDVVYYHIPLDGFSGIVNVSAKVYYQSLPPKWMEEMFAATSPEIETFREMYNNADQSPVLIQSAALADIPLNLVSTQEIAVNSIPLYPNPSTGTVFLPSLEDPVKQLSIYDISGKLLVQLNGPRASFELPETPGIYVIKVETSKEVLTNRIVKK